MQNAAVAVAPGRSGTSKNIAPGSDEAIKERLHLLLDTYTQAELARRTGVVPANVSRYFKATKVPAEFCMALVREVRVNPVWLMCGKGSMYLSDVHESTVGTASVLLELVQAMHSLTSMRLELITRRSGRGTIRKLKEGLAIYERLREQLNQHSRPVYLQLLIDYKHAIGERDVKTAAHLRKALEQVSRLCEDEAYSFTFDVHKSEHEFMLGNSMEALELQRLIAERTLADRLPVDADAHVRIGNYVAAVIGTGRLRQARRVCRATLALLGSEPQHQAHWWLHFQNAELGFLLQEVEPNLTGMLTCLPRLSGHLWHRERSSVIAAMLATDSISFAQAIAAVKEHTDQGLAAAVLRFAAMWIEDADALREACEVCADPYDWDNPRTKASVVHARAVLSALETPSKDVLEKFNKQSAGFWFLPHDVRGPFHRALFTCQIARLVGQNKAALAALDQAERALAQFGTEISVSPIRYGLHYRNALKLIKENTHSNKHRALRQRAQRFFDDAFQDGFGCFARHATRPLTH